MNPAVFDPRTAAAGDWSALNRFENGLRAESWPNEPPVTVEETIQEVRDAPPFADLRVWVAWDAERQLAASARLYLLEGGEAASAGMVQIGTRMDQRRRGLGSRLLGEVAAAARARDRDLLIAGADVGVPSGAAFLARIGARLAQTSRTYQLDLGGIPSARVREWQERAAAPPAGLEAGRWTGSYPEAALEEVAAFKEAMTLAPQGELTAGRWRWTPDTLREQDAVLAREGTARQTLFLRDAASGVIAGYTETLWNPDRPELLRQGDTAVFPGYRGRGAGRWLKARMLLHILEERPEVSMVRTAAADESAAMLKINAELGFLPFKTWTLWQVGIDQVEAYLAGRPRR